MHIKRDLVVLGCHIGCRRGGGLLAILLLLSTEHDEFDGVDVIQAQRHVFCNGMAVVLESLKWQ